MTKKLKKLNEKQLKKRKKQILNDVNKIMNSLSEENKLQIEKIKKENQKMVGGK